MYGLQIGGELADLEAEQAFIDKINAVTSEPDSGATYGTGSFQFSGSVAFALPSPSPVDYASAIADLETAAAELSDPPTQAQLDAISASVAALQAMLTPPPAAPLAGPSGPVAQPVAAPGAEVNPQASAAAAFAVAEEPPPAVPVADAQPVV